MNIAAVLVLLLSLISCAREAPNNPTIKQHPIGTLYKAAGVWEYLPQSYGSIPSPVIIFLHGLGENGSGSAADLKRLEAFGIPNLIASGQWPTTRPFVVLAFQQVSGCPTADQIRSHIDFAINNYKVDRRRIYLTGLSCGAYGIEDYLEKYGDENLAAVIPIAGPIANAWLSKGCSLVEKLPIWSFFGDQDGASNYAGNTSAMQKFIACPNRKDVRYTVYPGVSHDSWTRTYDGSAGHDIYAWLLQQSR